MRRSVLALPALLAGACIYLPDAGLWDQLGQGDVTARAVGVPPGQAGGVQPLAGVVVELQGSPRRLTTTSSGRFTLRGLTAGQHVVLLRLDVDGTPPADRVARLVFNTPQRDGARAAMDLGDIELLLPGRVVGNVSLSSSGSVSDVAVVLRNAVGAPGPDSPASATVHPDGSGAFVLDGVGVGQWRLTAALGPAVAVSPPFEIESARDAHVDLALDPSLPPDTATLQVTLVDVPDGDIRPTLLLRGTPEAQAGLSQFFVPRAWVGEEEFALAAPGLVAGGPYTLEFQFPMDPEVMTVVVGGVVLLPGVNDLGRVFITRVEDCGECSTSGSSSGGSSSGGPAPIVVPSLPLGTAFNTWADGTGVLPCVPGPTSTLTDCVFVGFKRAMDITAYVPDCTDVTAEDSQQAFHWQCVAANGQVLLSNTQFRDGMGLRDLLDWSAGVRWAPMQLTASVAGMPVATSNAQPWWDDPITDFDGTNAPADPAGPAVLAVRGSATPNLSLADRERHAVVTEPGTTVTIPGGAVSMTRMRTLFLELSLDATPPAGTPQLLMDQVTGVRINALGYAAAGRGALAIRSSNALTLLALSGNCTEQAANPTQLSLVDVASSSSIALGGVVLSCQGLQPPAAIGITMSGGVTVNSALLDGCYDGLNIANVQPDTPDGSSILMTNIRVVGMRNSGVVVQAGIQVVLDNVRAAGNATSGVDLTGCTRPLLVNVAASNNTLDGVSVTASVGVVARGIYALHNNGAGLAWDSSTGFVGEVTAGRNLTSNISVSATGSLLLSRALLFDSAAGLQNGMAGAPLLTLANLVSRCDVDMDLDGAAPAVADVMDVIQCQGTAFPSGCGAVASGTWPYAPPTAPALSDLETVTVRNGVAGAVWTVGQELSRVWAPLGAAQVPQRGLCNTAQCGLVEYGLTAAAPAVPSMESVTGFHDWATTSMGQCDALGGVLGAQCLRQHALAYAPLLPYGQGTYRGLCAVGTPVSQVDCVSQDFIGAFQGTGGTTLGTSAVLSGTVVMVHSYASGVLTP